MKKKVQNKKSNVQLNTNNRISLVNRLFAYLIDYTILLLLYAIPIKYIYSVVTKKIEKIVTLNMLPVSYALLVFGLCLLISFYYLIYYPVYKFSGMTIGKRILGLKIIKTNGKDVDLKTMILREGVGVILLEGATYTISGHLYNLLDLLANINIEKSLTYVFGAVTILSVIYAVINRNNAMFHDRIAKTNVISIK